MKRFLIVLLGMGASAWLFGCSQRDVPRPQKGTLVSATGDQATNDWRSLLQRDYFLSSAQLRSLGSSDFGVVSNMYRARTNPVERLPIAWTLARGFSSAGAPLLIADVTTGYANQNLGDDEVDAFLKSVMLIGAGATESDAAFAFIQNAVWPDFWDKVRKWRAENETEMSDRLACYAIQGLGLCERAEVDALLLRLKESGSPKAGRLPGAICTAAFYRHLTRAKGPEFLWDNAIWQDRELSLLMEWYQTAEGSQWQRWYQESQPNDLPLR